MQQQQQCLIGWRGRHDAIGVAATAASRRASRLAELTLWRYSGNAVHVCIVVALIFILCHVLLESG